ncbi:hypothetical protein [Rhodococcus koreensis]
MAKKSNTTAAAWEKAKSTVKEHGDDLRALDSHGALYAWAKEHKLATTALFPKFKTELLKQLGIDYNELREQAYAQRREQIAAAAADGPLVELWTAADDEVNSFAICGPGGVVVTYNTFHDDDKTYRIGDQGSADRSVAEFAVFIAGKVREELDVEAARLTLHVLNHEVAADDPGLTRSALGAHVTVTIEIDQDNPAAEWCREPGYKSWRETDLRTLVADEAVAS